jgi:rubredoxin
MGIAVNTGRVIRMANEKHWIDNADSWICPECGLDVADPTDYGYKCPKCGFMDEKDIPGLWSKYKSLLEAYKVVCTQKADLEQKCGDLEEIVDELKIENRVLNAQIELVWLFLGRDGHDDK